MIFGDEYRFFKEVIIRTLNIPLLQMFSQVRNYDFWPNAV